MFTMGNYKTIKHGTTCANCIHYDGEICTKDIDSLNLDEDPIYKSPFDSCDDFEAYFEEEDE